MDEARYIVGIDLGTTNSAVFYVDTETDNRIQPFPIPQVTAAGEIDSPSLLPSFCYLPGGSELPKKAIVLPWNKDPKQVVGVFARDQGAAVPSRLVASAKSWLAHAGVDRKKPILPWGSDLGKQNQSPVGVTTLYLAHVREAWNHQFRKKKDREGNSCILENQQVVVTIPASFDETARELTITAARDAGFKNLVLLEEPLAAFYSWLNHHENDWREIIQPGERILVIDVGGGTTDFSFIEMDDKGALHRFAVGDHLLLGGDNIDMAIARSIEQEWNTKLDVTQWSMLVQLSRRAKEELLNDDSRESTTITLLARGSSVIQNTRKATLTRAKLMQLLDEGFYPACSVNAAPPRKSSAIREMGLPYAAEPAVTIHLLNFLRYAAAISGEENAMFPDKVLFNGGSMISAHVRERTMDVIDSWFPDRDTPVTIEGESLSLAVAIGAAYYGRVRRGEGVRVRGGISRSYFVAAANQAGEEELICVMSRDTDENVDIEVPGRFMLQTSEKVQFRLFSSATRLHDKPGDKVKRNDEISEVAPLITVLQFGKDEKRMIEVNLASRLTEIGTLELTVESVTTEHRWPLRFDLRPIADGAEVNETISVDKSKIDAVLAHLKRAFTEDPEVLKPLVRTLEEMLELERDDWSLPLLRDMADLLLDLQDERRRSPRHEARWLNLLGWCLRPGFGDPGDELRMRRVWKLWFQKVVHERDAQAVADWWVFWRRVAPGLRDGHQNQIGAVLSKTLMPKGKYRNTIREGQQAQREMWRCLGALELLSVKSKRGIGRVLLERVNKLEAYEYWVLARVGDRNLFHGPAELVLPARDAAAWFETILDARVSSQAESMRLFAISLIGAISGDRNRDLKQDLLNQGIVLLEAQNAPESWIQRLREHTHESEADQAKILGDSLPHGLQIVS